MAQPNGGISVIVPRLNEMTKDELAYSLSRFIVEVKKKDGKDFPGETLFEMVMAVQKYLNLQGSHLKFLDDESFITLKNTLDTIMKQRTAAGLGIKRRQAEIITVEEEELMWEMGVLGTDNPEKLLYTLFYLNGLNFALRAVKEHHNLRVGEFSQFQIMTDKDGTEYLRYTEDVSKCNAGGIDHRKVMPKVVDAYSNPNKDRCVITIYRKYLAHCPAEGVRPDALYLRPLAKPSTAVWYCCQRIGENKLSRIVNVLCNRAGLRGHRTNHSLRASSASRLYENNFDEQVVCETTGHRSNAVRSYKRTPASMKRSASFTIQGISKRQATSVTASSAGIGPQVESSDAVTSASTKTKNQTDDACNLQVQVHVHVNK